MSPELLHEAPVDDAQVEIVAAVARRRYGIYLSAAATGVIIGTSGASAVETGVDVSLLEIAMPLRRARGGLLAMVDNCMQN